MEKKLIFFSGGTSFYAKERESTRCKKNLLLICKGFVKNEWGIGMDVAFRLGVAKA
ncbi:hypothetical protein [Aneurinibacillus sp. REN35]|uniref:hypothetical protein n=1 Tax=Aneurinibacillus sp. REN35 TaxID=3237286 RepID=UPI0035276EAD